MNCVPNGSLWNYGLCISGAPALASTISLRVSFFLLPQDLTPTNLSVLDPRSGSNVHSWHISHSEYDTTTK